MKKMLVSWSTVLPAPSLYLHLQNGN